METSTNKNNKSWEWIRTKLVENNGIMENPEQLKKRGDYRFSFDIHNETMRDNKPITY